MTGFGTWTYTWDGENRLAIATDGSTAVTNGYDSMSRRVAKGTASETRRFAYDAWNPVRETVDAGGTLSTNFYVWGLDLSQTLQGAGGVGGLLSVVRGDAPYFAGYDANGNVTDYVSANGTTVAHYEFDPFGNTTAATGSMADTFAHRFSTKYWDSETELYYYGHMFYSPELGRWITVDPLMHEGSSHDIVPNGRGERVPDLSAYAAMANAAGNFIDPDGLATAGGCCGPDIGAGLIRQVVRIRSDFAVLKPEEKTQQCLRLVGFHAEHAWDIYPLVLIGNRDGQTAKEALGGQVRNGSGGELFGNVRDCEHTVSYEGKCFNAGYLNYVFWGTSWKLCFDHFGGWPHALASPFPLGLIPGRKPWDQRTQAGFWTRGKAVALAACRT
jgi:RHS repeat-associated protein